MLKCRLIKNTVMHFRCPLYELKFFSEKCDEMQVSTANLNVKRLSPIALTYALNIFYGHICDSFITSINDFLK